MARFLPYDYNQSHLVPITLKDHIYEGSLEEAIHLVVEELDLSAFEKLYKNDLTGRPAYPPKVLLKVILLAYSRGIKGSRPIEQACSENVLFLALAGGYQPDHSTIAAFITSMKDHIMPIFVQVLMICEEMDLLGGTHFALDGVKLPSNASKDHSGTFKELKKKRAKLKGKLKDLIRDHKQIDKLDIDPQVLRRQAQKRQLKRIHKHIKRLDHFLDSNEPKQGKKNKEIQSNISDNQSAKMPTSHGVIQGFNAQAVVDDKHQVIVHGEAMGNGQDTHNLKPMIRAAKDNLTSVGKPDNCLNNIKLTADANYHTNENIEFCEQENMDAYIPDVNFRKRDERFKDMERFRDGVNKPPKPGQPQKRDHFELKDFTYDPETDAYTCPMGHILQLKVKRHRMKNGVYRTYRMRDDHCVACPMRRQCMPNLKARHRHLCVPLEKLPQELTPSHRMQLKVDSDKGKYIYGKRIGTVEPVFGNIRYNKGLNRFNYRGRDKVNIQWLLYCLVHNIEKIAHYGMA